MSETTGGHDVLAEDEDRPRILLFFDYACSFCYVDGFRFDQLKEEYDVDVVLIPFELRPDMPSEGISARAEGLAHSKKVDEHLYKLAREGGYPMVLPDLIPHTHKALVMGEVARTAGMHETVHAAIFGAYFGEGLDIGDEDVLLAVADETGLGAEKVRAAWAEGTHEDRLHAYRHLGIGLGVDATPSALICNELMIGSRPYGVIRDAVQRCLLTAETVEQIAEEDGSSRPEA